MISKSVERDMKYRSLYDMIKYIQAGTNLHIGVLFLGNFGNEMCKLPRKHEIHSGSLCTQYKSMENGYKRCFRCRNLAVKKAFNDRISFGGHCINGIYEYTRPVMSGNDVACIIFIGNILNSISDNKRMKKLTSETDINCDSLEKNLSFEDCEVIGDILETHILMLLENCADKNKSINPLVENIKNYIHSNLEFDINISHIADFFHYNRLYLGRIFKKETGMSIKDYITSQRIETAKILLENTDNKIIHISSKSGFNNVTYFNRMFKSIIGMTPKEYRLSKK